MSSLNFTHPDPATRRAAMPLPTSATPDAVVGSLTISFARREVSRAGKLINLTPTEFKLLARLVRSAGQVVTHRQLLADVWGAEFIAHTHYLRLYMAQLRAKLEAEPAEPRRLVTEPGVGYRLVEPEA